MSADVGIDWFNREKDPHRLAPIPVIDHVQNTVAGVRVSSLNEIIPIAMRPEIEKALKKLTLHFKYVKPINFEKEEGKHTTGRVENKFQCFYSRTTTRRLSPDATAGRKKFG